MTEPCPGGLPMSLIVLEHWLISIFVIIGALDMSSFNGFRNDSERLANRHGALGVGAPYFGGIGSVARNNSHSLIDFVGDVFRGAAVEER